MKYEPDKSGPGAIRSNEQITRELAKLLTKPSMGQPGLWYSFSILVCPFCWVVLGDFTDENFQAQSLEPTEEIHLTLCH